MRVTELGRSFPADMSLCVYVREQARLIPEMAQHGPTYILYTCCSMITNGMVKALPIPRHGYKLELPGAPVLGEWPRDLRFTYSAAVFLPCVERSVCMNSMARPTCPFFLGVEGPSPSLAVPTRKRLPTVAATKDTEHVLCW